MKKLASVLLLIGILTPYSCDVRPIQSAWPDELIGFVFTGIPVLLTIVYALFNLVAAFWQWVSRHAGAFRRGLAVFYFVLFAGWLLPAIADTLRPLDPDDLLAMLAAAGLTLALFFRGRRMGPEARRVPLLILTIVGLPAVVWFVSEFKNLQYGAWIFTAGYALALTAELREPR